MANLPAIRRRTSRTEKDARAEQNPRSSELWLRIEAFLKMRSANTQRTYSGIISEWCKFLGADAGSPEAASKLSHAKDLHAMAYRTWLEKQPGERPRAQRKELSRKHSSKALETQNRRLKAERRVGLEHTLANATIAKKFTALRRLYRMLIGSGLASENPFDSDRVPSPAKDSGRKRPTEMIDFHLVKEIVSSPDTKTSKGLRDAAILCCLFGGALRRSEVSALRVGDVRRSSGGTTYLYLRSTKAKRDAEQALPGWAAKTVENLVKHRLKEGAGEGDFLIVGYTGQAGKTPTTEPISDSGIYKLFKLYCALAGAGKFVTPHSARATAITRLLASGIPHREVQEFSRHSSVQMVELYDKRRIGVDKNPGRTLDYD